MRIENRKWYRRRDGVVVGPVTDTGDWSGYPVCVPNLERGGVDWYTADGYYWSSEREDRRDLVEEVPDPNAKPASRFRVGSRVRDGKYPDHPTATVFAVRGHEVKLDWDGDDHDPETNDFWPETDFEPIDEAPVPASPSPVRTVTRKEIVPGKYGRIDVLVDPDDGGLFIKGLGFMRASELRDAARIFIELADALDDQS